jgi:hypothetical protein
MQPPDKHRGRPAGAASTDPTAISSGATSMPPTRLDRANLVLRCAWLRVHADLLEPMDPSGQLSAQLRDFAHLLESTYGEVSR